MLNTDSNHQEFVMKLGYGVKSGLLLGLVTLCLAQGCPSSTNTGAGDPGGGSIQGILIEPDDYTAGRVLTNINAAFQLTTAKEDNTIVSLFEVTASDDGMDLAPTGKRVFGHSDIPFFNNSRRLRIDFTTAAASVQITFGGGTFFSTEIGVLQGFDASGNLLAQYTTSPRASGKTEVMTITASNMAYAVAYAQGDGSFGRLDHLIVAP
jgi:hypothetical protein